MTINVERKPRSLVDSHDDGDSVPQLAADANLRVSCDSVTRDAGILHLNRTRILGARENYCPEGSMECCHADPKINNTSVNKLAKWASVVFVSKAHNM